MLPFRLDMFGKLPEPVGSTFQVMEVMVLEKPFELELLPGICQTVPF